MQGWLAMRGSSDWDRWERHWFVLRRGRLEYCEDPDKALELQGTSHAVGFGAAAAARAESRGSPGDAADLAMTRPWGFVLDFGGQPSGTPGGRINRRYAYLDPGSVEALEAWVGAIGREAGRLTGAGAWAEIEASKAAVEARSTAEAFVKSGGVVSPSPRRGRSPRGVRLGTPVTGSTWATGEDGASLSSPTQRPPLGPASPSHSSTFGWAEAMAGPSKAAVSSRPFSPRVVWQATGGKSSPELSQVAELSRTNSELQMQLDELRAVTKAAETAQQQVTEAAVTEMVLQSREAGSVAAEVRRLREDLRESQAAEAQARKELVEVRHMLSLGRADGTGELAALLKNLQLVEEERNELQKKLTAERAECQALKEARRSNDAFSGETDRQRLTAELNQEVLTRQRYAVMHAEEETKRIQLEERLNKAVRELADLQDLAPSRGRNEPQTMLLPGTDGKRSSPSFSDATTPALLASAVVAEQTKNVRVSFSITNVNFEKLTRSHKEQIRSSVVQKVGEAAGVGSGSVRVYLHGGSVKVCAEVLAKPGSDVGSLKERVGVSMT